MAEEPDPQIVERDALELERRELVLVVIDVDADLEQRAVAILAGGCVGEEIVVAEVVPCRFRVGEVALADPGPHDLDPDDIGRVRLRGLVEIGVERIAHGRFGGDRPGAEHEFLAKCDLLLRHEVCRGILVGRSSVVFGDLDGAVA